MTTRRDFLIGTGAGLTTLGALSLGGARLSGAQPVGQGGGAGLPLAAPATAVAGAGGRKPLVVSTWRHGVPANDVAWQVLATGGRALDADGVVA